MNERYVIDSIVVYNLFLDKQEDVILGCVDRVEIFNEGTADAAYTYNAPSTGDPPNENTLTIPSGTIGSQIKISIPGRTDHSYLREVEVYGNRGTCTPMK